MTYKNLPLALNKTSNKTHQPCSVATISVIMLGQTHLGEFKRGKHTLQFSFINIPELKIHQNNQQKPSNKNKNKRKQGNIGGVWQGPVTSPGSRHIAAGRGEEGRRRYISATACSSVISQPLRVPRWRRRHK